LVYGAAARNSSSPTTHFHFLLKMKIYQIPLAEYIARLANIAFDSGKYIAFGEAKYYQAVIS